MSLLLDDLLDISRITRGTLELRTEMTELAAVVDAAVETARPASTPSATSSPIDAAGRAGALRGGSAAARAGAVEPADERREVHRPGRHDPARARRAMRRRHDRVADTGIGIAPEALSRVFTMFSQVQVQPGSLGRRPRHRARAGEGAGRAARRHDRGAAAPGPGRGSEFIVRLPRRTISVEHDCQREPVFARTQRQRSAAC